MLDSSQLAAITASPYKKDFPLLANNPDLTFLDSAATSQRPRAVLDAQRPSARTARRQPAARPLQPLGRGDASD